MALDDLTPRLLPAPGAVPDDTLDDLPGPGITAEAIDAAAAAHEHAGLPPLDGPQLHHTALLLSTDATARRQLRQALPQPRHGWLAAGPALAAMLLTADTLGDLLATATTVLSP